MKLGEDRPRLVVVEGVQLATPLDPYLTLRALARYSGMSVNWLRERLEDPFAPLPCYRVPPGGKILVRRSEFDAWMSRYRQTGTEAHRIIREAFDAAAGSDGPDGRGGTAPWAG